MTTKPTIQIGDEVREMTDEEIGQYKKDQADFAAQAQADADRQALRIATLAKLGLTADEVNALLS
jgi:hypothetical protein